MTSISEDLEELKTQVKKLTDLYKSVFDRIEAFEKEEEDFKIIFETFYRIKGKFRDLDDDFSEME